jgi:hypothetical protein
LLDKKIHVSVLGTVEAHGHAACFGPFDEIFLFILESESFSAPRGIMNLNMASIKFFFMGPGFRFLKPDAVRGERLEAGRNASAVFFEGRPGGGVGATAEGSMAGSANRTVRGVFINTGVPVADTPRSGSNAFFVCRSG